MLTLLDSVIDCEITEPQPLALTLSVSDTIRPTSPEDALLQPWLTWVQSALPTLWASFTTALQANHPWFDHSGVLPALAMSVVLLTDDDIQALNKHYRHKDSATDVLTFSLLLEGQWHADVQETHGKLPAVPNDIPDWQDWMPPGMPVECPLELGEVYLSLSWVLAHATPALQATSPQSAQSLMSWRFYYLTERLIHGFLHLLGVHHDTLSDYNKVVAIQQQVLSDVFRALPVTHA